MNIIQLDKENSLLNSFLAELRDEVVHGDSMRFRRNIERIGEITAYEISRRFDYKNTPVKTPLATAQVQLPQNKVVLATILRAGLPMHTGMLNYLDKAENAFVSAYRTYKDEAHTEVDIHVEYLAAPSIEGKTLIVCDPMLATGGSMELAWKALQNHGTPKEVIFACVIAAQGALDYLQEVMPTDSTLYVATVDPVLNDNKYIVPGLGDAGDLCFGDKL